MTASAACCGVSKALPSAAGVAGVAALAGAADCDCAATIIGKRASSRRTRAAVITLELKSLDFMFSPFVMIRMAYLLPPPPRPPPPPPRAPPPPREPPRLEEPRD